MIEVIATQMFGQELGAEGRFSATLRTNQRDDVLIAVQVVEVEPVSNRRAEPDAEACQLCFIKSRQSVNEGSDAVGAVPRG